MVLCFTGHGQNLFITLSHFVDKPKKGWRVSIYFTQLKLMWVGRYKGQKYRCVRAATNLLSLELNLSSPLSHPSACQKYFWLVGGSIQDLLLAYNFQFLILSHASIDSPLPKRWVELYLQQARNSTSSVDDLLVISHVGLMGLCVRSCFRFSSLSRTRAKKWVSLYISVLAEKYNDLNLGCQLLGLNP